MFKDALRGLWFMGPFQRESVNILNVAKTEQCRTVSPCCVVMATPVPSPSHPVPCAPVSPVPQEELVPAGPGGVAQRPGGLHPGVQRGDSVGHRQADLQRHRSVDTVTPDSNQGLHD